SNLYFNLISKLDLLDQNLSPIVKTSIKPEIRSKIMALPLNKTEEELFTEISELLDSNKLKTQSILNNPQINISSISNKKVEELKYVLERINQLFLIPTKEIISLKEQNQIRFFNRDKLINYKLKVDSVRVILQNDTSLKRF